MPSLYTHFAAGALFPIHEWLKGHHSVAVRRRLEESQWWPAERLAAYRIERLRAFLSHIGTRVPYYRRQFAETGFDPARTESLADLERLPLLTKGLIRTHTEALKAEDAGPLARFSTGGSSGAPLIFHVGKDRVSHDVGAKWRVTRWWDVDIGDPEIVIWGSPIELGSQDLVRAARDRLLRTQLISAFELKKTKIGRILETIRRRRPRMLFGYPSAIAHIAGQAQARGIGMSGLGIRVAFVTSERLYDEQRHLIQDVFGCPVANGYGGRDAGYIAHECPSGGMHLMAEDIIVEIVDGAGNPLPAGRSGEIVVTHMATGAFPFVRYRTGDVGVMSERQCPCGRGLPLLEEIQGRTTDFVVAADGTVMHGLALIYILRELPGVARFKIIQESLEHTRVLLVTGTGFEKRSLETIRTGFRRRLGESVRIDIEQVEEIPGESSGKFRYVVSRVTGRG